MEKKSKLAHHKDCLKEVTDEKSQKRRHLRF